MKMVLTLARSPNVFSPLSGCAMMTCGSFWKIAATSITGMSCSAAENEPIRLPAMKNWILSAIEQCLVRRLRAALDDGDLQAVLLVGAVGDRLVEAAVLGFGQPVGAEGDLVERHRRAGQAPSAAAPAARPIVNLLMLRHDPSPLLSSRPHGATLESARASRISSPAATRCGRPHIASQPAQVARGMPPAALRGRPRASRAATDAQDSRPAAVAQESGCWIACAKSRRPLLSGAARQS